MLNYIPYTSTALTEDVILPQAIFVPCCVSVSDARRREIDSFLIFSSLLLLSWTPICSTTYHHTGLTSDSI